METNVQNSRIQIIHLTTEYATLRNCPYLSKVSWEGGLQVLDLEGSGIQMLEDLPETLEYLNISKTHIKTMPEIKNVTFLLADSLSFEDVTTPLRLPWESGYQYAERVRKWQRMGKALAAHPK